MNKEQQKPKRYLAANQYTDKIREVAKGGDQMVQWSVSLAWAMQMVHYAFLDGANWEKENQDE